MTAPSMSAELVRCRHCGRRNRVSAAAAGIPRCGNCHQPLPGRLPAPPRMVAPRLGPAVRQARDELEAHPGPFGPRHRPSWLGPGRRLAELRHEA
jgi:hypothetical protein